jgi:hypothetical protein
MEQTLKIGEKLISDLRNLSIEVFKKWKIWREWRKCMHRWVWKDARNTEKYVLEAENEGKSEHSENDEEGEDISLTKDLQDLDMEEFVLNWGKGNYFDKMI